MFISSLSDERKNFHKQAGPMLGDNRIMKCRFERLIRLSRRRSLSPTMADGEAGDIAYKNAIGSPYPSDIEKNTDFSSVDEPAAEEGTSFQRENSDNGRDLRRRKNIVIVHNHDVEDSDDGNIEYQVLKSKKKLCNLTRRRKQADTDKDAGQRRKQPVKRTGIVVDMPKKRRKLHVISDEILDIPPVEAPSMAKILKIVLHRLSPTGNFYHNF